MQDLKIYRESGKLRSQIIEEYEKLVNYNFPLEYKELLSKHNGLRFKKSAFDYYDEVIQKNEGNFIYFYFFKENNKYELGDSSSSMVYFLMDNEDFQKGIVPFAGTPNGDFICFDYRDDLKSDNPKIVLVHHDADDENGNLIISFLGNNFEEFMDSLYEYQKE